MSKALELHLEGITKDSFDDWLKNEAFITYASASNEKGLVELGVDGKGNYGVREGSENGKNTYFFQNKGKAIKAYKTLLS